MGAWGHGPFENDAAMDLVGGLADGPSGEVPGGLRSAMTGILETAEYLDGHDVDQALAAACLVAARLDPSVPITGSARKYLEGMRFTVDDELRWLAVRVFARAIDPSDNEWHYLWTDGGSFGEVEEGLAPYRRTLGDAAC